MHSAYACMYVPPPERINAMLHPLSVCMYLLLIGHIKLYARNKPHLAFWCATMLLASFRTVVCCVAMASGEAHAGLPTCAHARLVGEPARSLQHLVKLGACATCKSNSHATLLSKLNQLSNIAAQCAIGTCDVQSRSPADNVVNSFWASFQ